MNKNKNKKLFVSVLLLAAFAVWTAMVITVDVQPIGPQGKNVGFTALNSWFHRWVGVNMSLYTVTDVMGVIPFAVAAGFAVLGLAQLIKRKSLAAVDKDIIALGVFYAVVIAAYVLFEAIALNYRPVLIDGRPEASYPSSTVLLTLTVIPTAIIQLKKRIVNLAISRGITVLFTLFAVFMAVGRVVSGVHWISDIIGGCLLSGGLVIFYSFLNDRLNG